MKIMIMNCSNKNFWYKGKIGKTYPVKEVQTKDYIVSTKDAGGKIGYVLKQDAVIV